MCLFARISLRLSRFLTACLGANISLFGKSCCKSFVQERGAREGGRRGKMQSLELKFDSVVSAYALGLPGEREKEHPRPYFKRARAERECRGGC